MLRSFTASAAAYNLDAVARSNYGALATAAVAYVAVWGHGHRPIGLAVPSAPA